jgi:hypothetical protein
LRVVFRTVSPAAIFIALLAEGVPWIIDTRLRTIPFICLSN